jgi:diacylglycerol kinase (ATP)
VGLNRALVIVNPTAGRGRAARVWNELRDLQGGGVECVMTEAPGHARRIALEATRRGVERVVVVGGDGTVSEVAHGVAGTQVALGVVPAGTGNDFSRALGLPAAVGAAARVAFGGCTRWVDLGQARIGERCVAFVNVAGCGFDAEVVRRTSTAPHLGGTLPYLIGILRTLSAFRPRSLRFVLDGQQFERHALGVAVANGAWYGGGMRIAPGAAIDDGLFDICLMGQINPMQLLALLPRLYAGTHAGHRAVEFFRGRELRVEPVSSADVSCQADGELLGQIPVTFSIQPRRLLCVTGQGP